MQSFAKEKPRLTERHKRNTLFLFIYLISAKKRKETPPFLSQHFPLKSQKTKLSLLLFFCVGTITIRQVVKRIKWAEIRIRRNDKRKQAHKGQKDQVTL